MATAFRPSWRKIVPYALIHVVTIAAAVWTGATGELLLLAGALYLVRVMGATLAYHRYFSHRSFKTSRAFQFVLGLWANLSMMRGPIQWAAHHRYHHRHADRETDLHSPRHRGTWYAHTGWFLTRELDETRLGEVRDLQKFPELRWLDRHYWVASTVLSAALLVLGGWPALVWGGFVSTVVAWHAIFMINSLAHRLGTQRFDSGDDSGNSFVLALLLCGEGWHNNHHHYMHSARAGFRWWEIDLTYYVLWGLARLRLVRDLRPAPALESDAPAEEVVRGGGP